MTIFFLIIILRANFFPQNLLQTLYIYLIKRLICLKLCNCNIILMLTNIEFSFCLVILQFIILKLRIIPLSRQNFICKICIVFNDSFRQILHKITKTYSDMLKFINTSIVYIVCMENLIDKFRLHLNLRDIGYAGNAFNLFEKVTSMSSVSFASQIC